MKKPMDRKTFGSVMLANVLEMNMNKYSNYVKRFFAKTADNRFYRALYIDDRILRNCSDGLSGVVEREGNDFVFYGRKCVKLDFDQKNEPDDLSWKYSMIWIRMRNKFLHHVMATLLVAQRRFLETGDLKSMVPMSLTGFVENWPFPYLDLGRLSRLLNNTWIRFGANNVLLRDLFSSRRKILMALLADVTYDRPERMNDREIQALLKREYGTDLSIRTICHYRNSLHIPAYNKEHLGHSRGHSFSALLALRRKSLHRIPQSPGVYEFSLHGRIDYPRGASRVIYYGCSKNLRNRIRSYLYSHTKNPVIRYYREQGAVYVEVRASRSLRP